MSKRKPNKNRKSSQENKRRSTPQNERKATPAKKSTSKSTYTFKKKISHLFNSATSFSESPLILIFLFGLFLFFVSTITSLFYGIKHLFFESLLDGFTSIVMSIWFLGGTIILIQGIIGLYLSKVFLEIKKRPIYVIKSIHSN